MTDEVSLATAKPRLVVALAERVPINTDRMAAVILAAGLIAVACFLFLQFTDEYGDWQHRLMAALLVALLAIMAYTALSIVLSFAATSAINRDASIQIKIKSEELQEKIEEDFFNNLVKINFKYIDKYYLQTQLQADKSFYTALVAGAIGLSITIAGIVMMYLGKTEPAYVTTATGLISQFIAATFFYMYNNTVMRMADYHKKLVLTQNIGLALRITDDLEGDHKSASQTQLIERLTFDINTHLSA